MRLLLFLCVFVVMAGCVSYHTPTYANFEHARNFTIEEGRALEHAIGTIYKRKDYTDNQYIYIYTYKGARYGTDERCIWGYITDKDDPWQRAKDWVVLDGYEFCKRGGWQGWF